MNLKEFKFPGAAQLAFVLISLALIVAFLTIASGILVPILMAMLFAILLRPVVCFLNKKLRFPHVIAVMTSVVLFVLVIVGILFFVSWKVGDMASDWDSIKTNLNAHYHNIQHWVKEEFNISYRDQVKYIQQAGQGSLPGKEMIGSTMSSFTDVLLNAVLVPIYMFLFLLYRNLFLKFLSKLFKAENQHRVKDVLTNVKLSIQSYLTGIMIEVLIVSTLTSIGLSIIGVKYAILLGVITGVLNLIPYIGILIAGSLSIVATLTSSADLSIIFGVIGVNVVVQLIDNNILIPIVVSSKVKINAFISIVAIIIGGAIAGVAGMFLAIPLTAILKVIFDRVESLEPWGYLMGDDIPKTYEWGKMKLPSYDFGDITEEEVSTPDQSPETSQESTRPAKEEDK
jgi:predicted PurR-regulated permease PerM